MSQKLIKNKNLKRFKWYREDKIFLLRGAKTDHVHCKVRFQIK